MGEKQTMALYRESVFVETGRGMGDDALPYIGENLISVADGAGGRAYARHSDINPALLEPEISFETAVKGIIRQDDAGWLSYREQYMQSFFNEGFDLSKDYRGTDGRKSSYFGSRLASIFIRYILESQIFVEKTDEGVLEKISVDQFFEKLSEMDDMQREAAAKDVADVIAESLFVYMRKAAENCGLRFREGVSISNVNLMSTTFSGIIYCEHNDYVDTMTIQAGDSLPYAFLMEEADGESFLTMKLLDKAQEREDGGMTNCICADADFYLSCRYRRLSKPCIIFGASDGCFDAFATPAHFERFLLERIRPGLQSGNLEQTAEDMKRYFMSGVTSDDSSSMALAAFGVTPEMRTKMQSRVEQLTNHFRLDDSDLYSEQDPPEDRLKTLNTQRTQKLLSFRKEFWENSEWIRDQILGVDQESPEEKRKKEEKKQTLELQLKEAYTTLFQIICRQWYSLQQAQTYGVSPGFKMYDSDIQAMRSSDTEKKYNDQLKSDARDQYDNSREELEQNIRQVRAIDPETGDDAQNALKRIIEKANTFLQRMVQSIQSIKKAQTDNRILSDQHLDLENKIIKEDQLLIKMYCMLLAGDIREQSFDSWMGPDSRMQYAEGVWEQLQKDPEWQDISKEQIADLVDELLSLQRTPAALDHKAEDELRQIKRQIENVKAELNQMNAGINQAEMEKAKRTFLDRPMKLIVECFTEHADTLPEEFRKKLEREQEDSRAEIERVETLVQDKKALMEEYDAGYESFVCEEAQECQ